MSKWIALAGMLTLTACGGPHYKLYRNSVLSDERVQWASFDADESGDYNKENCEMAADLLNRNIQRLNGGASPIGFWCERTGILG